MIDIYAPIIPYESLGGIKLYSTIKELRDIITGKNVTARIFFNKKIRFNIDDTIMLYFHLYNGKLYKIGACEKYKGKLFDKIYVGLPEEDIVKVEPTFVYNDFEEFYETPKGASIATNGYTVEWIGVYIKETDDEDFDEANW